MNLQERIRLADDLHNQKYNCAQAVLLAYADKTGADKETLFKISEGFGFGMGTSRGTCGALTGALMLAGLAGSDGDLDAPGSKQKTYALDRELFEYFTEKTGSSVCRELKGLDTGRMLCSCPDCIRCGVEAAAAVLFPD